MARISLIALVAALATTVFASPEPMKMAMDKRQAPAAPSVTAYPMTNGTGPGNGTCDSCETKKWVSTITETVCPICTGGKGPSYTTVYVTTCTSVLPPPPPTGQVPPPPPPPPATGPPATGPPATGPPAVTQPSAPMVHPTSPVSPYAGDASIAGISYLLLGACGFMALL